MAYGVEPKTAGVGDTATRAMRTRNTALTAGLAPGSVPGSGAVSDKWFGHDALDHQATVGQQLKRPPALKCCLIGDSTLRLYGKKSTQHRSPGHFVKAKYQSYEITGIVCCSASLRTLLNQHMPREKATVEAFDVTLFVTMLNGIPGSTDAEHFLFSEESAFGAQLLHMCRRLKEHKRGVVCIAGRSVRWGLPP